MTPTPPEHTWPRPRLEAEYREVLEALRFCLEWIERAYYAHDDGIGIVVGYPRRQDHVVSYLEIAQELAHLRRVARLAPVQAKENDDG